ncbi:MAG: hypothetical protein O3C21_00415 [Verrucomicrobia bacterium]|nr:hypothetical protein [Verrucomicrobiota bacterium]
MSKRTNRQKKHKKKSKPATQPTEFDPVAAGEKARLEFAEGNFRRAGEGFRRLLNTDAAVFGPLYVDATLGHVEELIAGDRLSQAESIISQVRTLAAEHSFDISRLELRLAASKGQWLEAGAFAAKAWGDGGNAQSLALGTRQLVADALVLAFAPVPCADSSLAHEAEAIMNALHAVAGSKWEAVDELLRPIGTQSPFAQWKLLIKGIAAFHTQDSTRAIRFFEKVDKGCVPGRAAGAWLSLAQDEVASGAEVDDAGIALMAHFAGQPDASAYLPSVQRYWNRAQPDQAFRLLQQKQPAFPAVSHGLWGRMTDMFLVRARLSENADDRLGEFLARQLRAAKFRSEEERAVMYRWAVLAWGAEWNADFLVQDWLNYLEACELVMGTNDKLAARVHASIARGLIPEDGAPSPTAIPLIRKHASASIARNEHDLTATLVLLEAYSKAGMTQERDELLTELPSRFPGEKEILLEAGRRFTERGKFGKAFELFHQALAIDPLDRRITAALVEALGEKAYNLYKDDRPDRGLACFEEMQPYLRDDDSDFELGRMIQGAKRCVFEMMWVKQTRKVVKTINSYWDSYEPHVFRFFLSVMAGCYFPREPDFKDRRVSFGEVPKTKADAGNALLMIGGLKHFRLKLSTTWLDDLAADMQGHLDEAIDSQAITVEQARQLILEQDRVPLDLSVPELITLGRKLYPDDHLLRLTEICEDMLEQVDRLTPDRLDDLRQELKSAERAGDRTAVDFGRSKLSWFERELRRRRYGDEDEDDDDYVDGLERAAQIEAEIDGLERKIPGLRAMLEALSKMSPSEQEQLRIQEGLPKDTFATMVILATGLRMATRIRNAADGNERPAPEPRSMPRTPRPEISVPDQLNLFPNV